ncbi:hypothetical protein ACIQVT_15305 [Streptomyces sp. NPDC100445]
MSEGLPGIGAFAARARLSREALWLYDRLGAGLPYRLPRSAGNGGGA